MKIVIAVLAASVFLFNASTHAQPAPTFHAHCNDLRKAMSDLGGREDRELVTIEVEGPLALVHESNGLVYLGVCGPPAPRVLCVTYETNGRKVGEKVVVVGSIVPRGPDFVQLDPCLHHLPEDRE
jgi:hypothetical protein